MKCKVSGKKISPFMSFGRMPMANGFLDKKDFKKEYFYNLEVGLSEENYLFQVNNHPKSNKIFNNKYPFYTNKSNYMIVHFKEYYSWLKRNFLKSNSKVIEIGSNDGTFLKNFKRGGYTHLGFEPSKNVANISKKMGINVIKDFFNYKNISNLKNFKNQTDLICAANVICHIPNLNDLIISVDRLLSKKGVFVFEEPYLGSMLKKVSYDQIYDAHVFMFSLLSVNKIFKNFDLELVDAYPQPTHGGSMRYVICRKKTRKVSKLVKKIINKEILMKMNSLDAYLKFKKDCENSKNYFYEKVFKLKKQGKKICGYAAAAKSTTVLNYCKINNKIVDFIADSTKEKIGKFSPGMHIPVVSINHFRKKQSDIAILFGWNHRNEILNKEKKYTKKGGKWISHVKI